MGHLQVFITKLITPVSVVNFKETSQMFLRYDKLHLSAQHLSEAVTDVSSPQQSLVFV